MIAFDAVRALFDRLLGQADEERFRDGAGRHIYFDLDGQCVDAEQREGVELGEHAGQFSRQAPVILYIANFAVPDRGGL